MAKHPYTSLSVSASSFSFAAMILKASKDFSLASWIFDVGNPLLRISKASVNDITTSISVKYN